VRRFLLWLVVCGLTVIAVNSALAKGGPLHLFLSQLPSASQAGVPAKQPGSPSETFGVADGDVIATRTRTGVGVQRMSAIEVRSPSGPSRHFAGLQNWAAIGA
jgi:hypothetical protein